MTSQGLQGRMQGVRQAQGLLRVPRVVVEVADVCGRWRAGIPCRCAVCGAAACGQAWRRREVRRLGREGPSVMLTIALQFLDHKKQCTENSMLKIYFQYTLSSAQTCFMHWLMITSSQKEEFVPIFQTFIVSKSNLMGY